MGGEGEGKRGRRVLKLNLCTNRPVGKMLGCNPLMKPYGDGPSGSNVIGEFV